MERVTALLFLLLISIGTVFSETTINGISNGRYVGYRVGSIGVYTDGKYGIELLDKNGSIVTSDPQNSLSSLTDDAKITWCYFVDNSTQTGRDIYALLLAAKFSGTPVIVFLDGTLSIQFNGVTRSGIKIVFATTEN